MQVKSKRSRVLGSNNWAKGSRDVEREGRGSLELADT